MSTNKKVINVSRRQILRGAGGATLTLPFLPSLAVKNAYGADPTYVAPPRFICMTTEHGGIDGKNMYPSDATLKNTAAVFSGHNARQGTLARSVSGDTASLSPVLTGPASLLTDGLVSKMNILRGFDVPHDIGHNTGGHLGNYARCDQPPSETTLVPFPTIDQVMAWSPSFYKGFTPKMRSIVTGGDFRGISWGYQNPSTKSGDIVKIDVQSNASALFSQLFVPGQPAAPATTTPSMPAAPTPPVVVKRKSVVDGVLAGYNSLRQSNTRLSAADKVRIDAHIAFLSDLQKRVSPPASGGGGSGGSSGGGGGGAVPKTCGNIQPLSTSGYKAISDCIMAAFACDTSRIATICVLDVFVPFGGDWHQDVAHHDTEPDKQKLLSDNLQITFQNVYLDLISKLDNAEEAPGHTYLDSSLVMWSQESGQSTHDSHGSPVVAAGGAAGFFNTGNFIDYRNTAKSWDAGEHKTDYMGVTHRQWMANVLQSMGVPTSEFERDGKAGYGETFFQANQSANEPEEFSRASDILPFLKKT